MTVLDPPPSTEPPQSAKAKVFRDPIHDLIYFAPEDRWLVDVIASKEFQRLRRIRQLGLAYLVYPGAEHSRFVHSLGVFDVARRMIRKLKHRHDDDGAIGDELDKKSKTIKVAALLHDLGHGPFSHVFERVFRESEPPPPKHAEWACRLLRDEETEIGACLQHNEVPIDEVCSLISDAEVPPDPLYLRDIVNSQLDADRMDYLLRDSLMTGSRYGQFDSEWILNALMIAEPQIGELTVKKLCLDASKGTGAIEGFLFARLQMLRYVYGHKTTRAYEAELVQTLRLALRLHATLPDDTPPQVRTLIAKAGSVTAKEYLSLDDEVMWWALRRWATWDGPAGSDGALARALKDHSLRLVRRHQPWAFIEVKEGEPWIAALQFYERLIKEDNPLQYECFLDTLEDLPYKDFRYLIQTGKGKGASDEAGFFGDIFGEIYLVGPDDKAERLSKYDKSPILAGLAQEFKLYRFYFNRRFSEEFAGHLK